jgi:cytoskeletal protein RodZ
VYETSRRNGSSAQGIGAVLRERREAMGVTLAETEAATRIRQKYLAALESDEWHLLPGEVVGRGFLRNYAGYLGLEPTEIIERRRAMANDRMTSQLANTSAGTALPPVRQVDYRPKEVDLRDEPDIMERREVRLAPWLTALVVVILAGLLWWGRDSLDDQTRTAFGFIQQQVEHVRTAASEPEATATPPVDAGVVNPANVGGGTAQPSVSDTTENVANTPAPAAGDGQNGGQSDATDTSGDGQSEQPVGVAVVLPTPTPSSTMTPTPETPPTPTPPPTQAPLLPTATPAEPTPTPTPEVLPPVCADPSSAITSPGVGQVVSGVVPVTGTANNPAFQYYKLEFAPGANATGGFVYFAGQNTPVVGGLLGNFNSTAVPNGDYTLRIVVVDQTGNFSPPCQVTISVQN